MTRHVGGVSRNIRKLQQVGLRRCRGKRLQGLRRGQQGRWRSVWRSHGRSGDWHGEAMLQPQPQLVEDACSQLPGKCRATAACVQTLSMKVRTLRI